MAQEHLLDQVLKPGRYIGMEHNAYNKKFQDSTCNICLCFPDIYEIGMSTLGMQILYSILNEQDTVVCDRSYLPWDDMRLVLKDNKEKLWGLETKKSLDKFDLLGFSISYEMNYTNILGMLNLANIPIFAKNRTDEHPLILIGGGGVYNPEPIVDFADAVFIGEAEEAFLQISEIIHKAKQDNQSKSFVLEQLAFVEGMYIPHLFSNTISKDKIINKRYVKNLENVFFPTKQLVPLINTVHCRAQIEIMRGCPGGCRFCQAGNVYGPVRQRSYENILELCKQSLETTGFEELSFLSLSSGSYSQIEKITSEIHSQFKSKGVGLSLPSLRIENAIHESPKLLASLMKTGLTFAPEAGSERLRKLINKNINIENLKVCVEKAYEYGWKKVKLYFMIGLPSETYDDLNELCNLVNEVTDIFYKKKKKKQKSVVVSIANFVPKPHTAFQWCTIDTIETLYEKQQYILKRTNLKRVKLDFHPPEITFIESLLCSGNRDISTIIYEAYRKGLLLQSWSDFFDFNGWKDVFSSLDFDAESEVYRKKVCSDTLPWDHIQTIRTKDQLREEYESIGL